MDLKLPNRRGTSKRTRERMIEDIVKSSMQTINVNSRDECDSNNPQNDNVLESESLEGKGKKQKIDIISVEVLYTPTALSLQSPLEVKDIDMDSEEPPSNSLRLPSVQNEIEDPKDINSEFHYENDSDNNSNISEETIVRKKCTNLSNRDGQKQFMDDLRVWSLRYDIKANALSALLALLIQFGLTFLPKDSRTLKDTPRITETREVEPGTYWHFGIKRYLSILKEIKVSLPQSLTLNLSMDGLPICKSSKGSFWPILGKFKEIPAMVPFVIGLYFHESSKPLNPGRYLEDLINELKDLSNNLFRGTLVKVGTFVFDAVASAFIRGIVPHNAYRACPKCTTTGSYHGRMCYPSMNSTPRNNANFRAREDVNHHSKHFKEPNSSPLEALDIDIVKSCPGDYMHLILLGVTKKFLKIILRKSKIPTNALLRMKLNKINLKGITDGIARAYLYQPFDFCRKIRTLEYINFFKANELRTFLCYHGIVVLKGNIHPELYECFKVLHCAVSICLSKRHIHKLLPLARELFLTFIKLFIKVFGENMVSYNVHNLQHVVDDVIENGPLDQFSAFEFESFLGVLKKYILSGKHPLAEMANRVVEHVHFVVENLKKKLNKQEQYPKYSRFKLNLTSDITINNSHQNSWFLTKDKRIVRFEKIEEIDNTPKIFGKRIITTTDYFELPIKSSILNIYYSDGALGTITPIDISEVSEKLFCIPDADDFKVFIPILHS